MRTILHSKSSTRPPSPIQLLPVAYGSLNPNPNPFPGNDMSMMLFLRYPEMKRSASCRI